MYWQGYLWVHVEKITNIICLECYSVRDYYVITKRTLEVWPMVLHRAAHLFTYIDAVLLNKTRLHMSTNSFSCLWRQGFFSVTKLNRWERRGEHISATSIQRVGTSTGASKRWDCSETMALKSVYGTGSMYVDYVYKVN